MDELNHAMGVRNIKPEMRRELRRFMIDARPRREAIVAQTLMGEMSPQLRAEVADHLRGRYIRKVWFIGSHSKGVSNEFIASICLALDTTVWAIDESIKSRGTMNIVSRG